MRYKVLTEIDARREVFANFFTNSRASSAARKTRSEEARDTTDNALDNKITVISSSDQESGSDLTNVRKNTAFRKDYKAEKAQTEGRLLKKTARTFSEMTEGAKFSVAQRIWNDKNEVYKDMREHIKKTSARTGWNQHQGVISYLKSQVGKTNEAMWQDVRNKIAEATGTEPTIVDVQMALWERQQKTGTTVRSRKPRLSGRRLT